MSLDLDAESPFARLVEGPSSSARALCWREEAAASKAAWPGSCALRTMRFVDADVEGGGRAFHRAAETPLPSLLLLSICGVGFGLGLACWDYQMCEVGSDVACDVCAGVWDIAAKLVQSVGVVIGRQLLGCAHPNDMEYLSKHDDLLIAVYQYTCCPVGWTFPH